MTVLANSLGRDTPNVVANGCTGVNSTTAYAVACAGTSSTNPVQFLASLGTSGQILTSGGASTLPSFSSAPTISGAIVQIVGGVIPSASLYSSPLSSSYVDSLVEQSITPTSSSNSILIFCSFGVRMAPIASNSGATTALLGVQLWRGGSSIVDYGNGQWGGANCASGAGTGLNDLFFYSTFLYKDSPATTSSTTYSLYVNNANGNGSDNQVAMNGDAYIYLAELKS